MICRQRPQKLSEFIWFLQLGQSRLILNRIVEICKQINMPPAAIFCGDFNSKPESAIYSFVHEGELDCFMEDRRVLSGQLENEGKGWPTVGRPTPAQMMRLRPRVSPDSNTCTKNEDMSPPCQDKTSGSDCNSKYDTSSLYVTEGCSGFALA